jgi:hypothetical protein
MPSHKNSPETPDRYHTRKQYTYAHFQTPHTMLSTGTPFTLVMPALKEGAWVIRGS